MPVPKDQLYVLARLLLQEGPLSHDNYEVPIHPALVYLSSDTVLPVKAADKHSNGHTSLQVALSYIILLHKVQEVARHH
jgi:hypothetical protein